MKVDINKQSLLFKYQFEEQDLDDMEAALRLVNSGDWKALMRFCSVVREAIIDSVKSVGFSEPAMKMAAVKAATLSGFDRALELPEEIYKGAAHLRAEKLRKEDAQDAVSTDE